MLFRLGKLVSTPGALAAFERTQENPAVYLALYVSGYWGECCPEDCEANNRAILNGERILGAYKLDDGTKIWIITEWDRSITTFLLPEEY